MESQIKKIHQQLVSKQVCCTDLIQQKLDLLKTDYFHSDAYPTYLYYNPYNELKVIDISLSTGTYDLYDAVSNSFIFTPSILIY